MSGLRHLLLTLTYKLHIMCLLAEEEVSEYLQDHVFSLGFEVLFVFPLHFFYFYL